MVWRAVLKSSAACLAITLSQTARADNSIQPTGQFEGPFTTPQIRGKLALYSGYKYTGIVIDYLEKITFKVPDGPRAGWLETVERNYICQFVMDDKRAGDARLVDNFGINSRTASENCPRTLKVSVAASPISPEIEVALKDYKFKTKLQAPKYSTVVAHDNAAAVSTAGIDLSMSYARAKEIFSERGYVVSERNSTDKNNNMVLKTVLAYKPIDLKTVKETCSQINSSGIDPTEKVTILFPHNENMNNEKPIIILRTYSILPPDKIPTLEIRQKTIDTYGNPTDKYDNAWYYDQTARLRPQSDGRGLGNGTRTITMPNPGVVYQCSSRDSVNVSEGWSQSTMTLQVPDDPSIGFVRRFELTSDPKTNTYAIRLINRNAAVSVLNHIDAQLIDYSISKTIDDKNKAKKIETPL